MCMLKKIRRFFLTIYIKCYKMLVRRVERVKFIIQDVRG